MSATGNNTKKEVIKNNALILTTKSKYFQL